MAQIFYLPFRPAFDANGQIIPGARLDFYLSGTLTRTPVYTSIELMVEHPNPVIADAAGRFPPIYLSSQITYRVRLHDETGVLVSEIDPYTSGAAGQGNPGLPGNDGENGKDGINGAPGSSAGFAALFAAAPGMAIAAGITRVRFSGNTLPNYAFDAVHDQSKNAAFVVANSLWSFQAADGRVFVIDLTQSLAPEMFGAVRDGVTDDVAAFRAMITVASREYNPGGPQRGTVPIALSAGTYFISDTIELKRGTFHIKGAGSGGAGGDSTRIRVAANKTGFRTQRADTTGLTTAPETLGADDTIFEGFRLQSDGGTALQPFDGIHARTRVRLVDVRLSGFPRSGFFIHANQGAGGAIEGNANLFYLDRVTCGRNGFAGMSVRGSDANAGVAILCNFSVNGYFGIDDQSFLGNTYLAPHTEANGVPEAGMGLGAGNTSVVHHLGNYYFVGRGQAAAAKTTTPGTNSNVWRPYGSGGVSYFAPQWVPNGPYIEGGWARFTGESARNVIIGPYNEFNQAPAFAEKLTLVLGGSDLAGAYGGAVRLDATGGRLFSTSQIQSGDTGAFFSALGGEDFATWWSGSAAGHGGVWRLKPIGNNVGFNYNNFERAYTIAGEITEFAPGRASPEPFGFYPRKLFVTDVDGDIASNARRFFTTSGEPAGANYAVGDFAIKRDSGVGGIMSFYRAANGSWQPTGIIGGVQAASVPFAAGASPTKAEFDALVNALKSAKLMAA